MSGNITIIPDPSAAIRAAILQRMDDLGIMDKGHRQDLLGNVVMLLEILAQRHFEAGGSDQSFQERIETLYVEAEEKKRELLNLKAVRGHEPDDRFPAGFIDYYTGKCRTDRFVEDRFVSGDGTLELSSEDAYRAIVADLHMAGARAALTIMGKTDSRVFAGAEVKR